MSSHPSRNPQEHMSISALLSPDTDAPDVIRAVVQQHFDKALESMPPRNDMTDPGLIVQFGETILHLQAMVESIAKELANSGYHGQNADRALDLGFRDGGNMGTLADMSAQFKTHTALSEITASLHESMRVSRAALDAVTRAKRPLPPSDPRFSPRSSISASVRTESFSGSRPGNRSVISDMSPPGALMYSANPSPESMDSPASPVYKMEPPFYDTEMDIDMKSLANRGKSSYVCKYGKSCTKGGVDRNGNMIEFVRHCMIRQHIDKHEKPYRCTIEGCPNKEGFARRDQLERHTKNVKHGADS
ncbi:hypothetical protein F5X68DRAFT_78628 [Plectosphaerella plurivora]|uniref:C2H2-type domain-containing protein n=1 Tax=Plectosphaerella plurivora TaxID=936078 RepID=A0A9P8VEU8_9PEZI|nr:hypothetical protein F5X68DRAFT_78628 [Plectosphaerella plurivora]